MNKNPAIIVSAYNRPKPLYRLLQSIAGAVYAESDIPLIISIDKSGEEDVSAVANSFEWKYGEKKVIHHDAHLGLKEHILACGDLTEFYDSVIILEDDLLVSPYFYTYAQQARDFYIDEAKVAGISLYNYQVAESCFYPFRAIDDGSDVYFMQVASSWGQLFTKTHWQNFRKWLVKNPDLPNEAFIPEYLKKWGANSWKKHYIHYLISEKKYFVFPRLSLTTNFEEEGTNAATKNVFHVVVQLSNKTYSFQPFSASKSIYDACFEIEASCLNEFNVKLKAYDYEVDLYGHKKIGATSKPYILTSKKGQQALLNFSTELFPLEANVVMNQLGTGISLYQTHANHLQTQELPLNNFLEEQNGKSYRHLTVVIPILKWDEQTLKVTLDSIVRQDYPYVKVVMVSNISNKNLLEKTRSAYNLDCSIISTNDTVIPEYLHYKGFSSIKGGIITWLNCGSVLNENSIHQVVTIFKQFPMINWIRGIQETNLSSDDYQTKDVFNYRLNKGEVYERMSKNAINTSVEGDFFRYYCLTLLNEPLTMEQFFFYLIEKHYLHIVVSNFVKALNQRVSPAFTVTQKERLLKRYSHFQSQHNNKLKFINLILKASVLKNKNVNWFYVAINNFPDVIRYDGKNKSFYLSKY
jgi:hypothetical protein